MRSTNVDSSCSYLATKRVPAKLVSSDTKVLDLDQPLGFLLAYRLKVLVDFSNAVTHVRRSISALA